jgi:dinuclear metal center YbgI/SA1388 family protein
MVLLNDLVAECEKVLSPSSFQDYCPNGLQVEGRPEVKKLVSGVTASLALLEAAIEQGADAVLVHHGYFWKGESAALIGMKRRRLAALIKNDISLIAYHLPLDAHAKLGNNVQLAQRLGLSITGSLQPGRSDGLGLEGELKEVVTFDAFSELLARQLGQAPVAIDGGAGDIQRVAWCTGAAQAYLKDAVALGVDAFISGEISESTVHMARECGVHYFAAGHHATERYGVKALGEYLAETLAISHNFVDIANPV